MDVPTAERGERTGKTTFFPVSSRREWQGCPSRRIRKGRRPAEFESQLPVTPTLPTAVQAAAGQGRIPTACPLDGASRSRGGGSNESRAPHSWHSKKMRRRRTLKGVLARLHAP